MSYFFKLIETSTHVKCMYINLQDLLFKPVFFLILTLRLFYDGSFYVLELYNNNKYLILNNKYLL